MKKGFYGVWKGRIMILIFFCFSYFCSEAQQYWTLRSTNHLAANQGILPSSFELDTAGFFNGLRTGQSISFPLDHALFLQVNVEPCSNFSKELSAKYPGILSFCNTSSGPAVSVDIYNHKLHIYILSHGSSYFIEPDGTIPNLYHLTNGHSYSPVEHENFNCQTQEPAFDPNQVNSIHLRSNPLQKTKLRTYRLALAVTGEFARSHGVDKEAVMAAVNSHVSRINTVFKIEHGIQFELVPNNDTLIFMDPATDPYTNGNVSVMLDQNPKILNDRIGLNNYDIGHVFGTNAGGVALLGGACGALKGAGVSSTFGIYNGLQFYLIPCHEIGHQFNATHTFNFCDNENETSSSAFEPGSGSTIMSYAGASNCGANYVQGISDPYFHAFSLQQIKTYSRNGVGSFCGTEMIHSNEEPLSIVISPSNKTIPILTPFELQGDGIDDTGSSLTYTWEEMDLGQKSPLGTPLGTAPLFRSIPPDINPIRIFPKLSSILNNQNNITEVLPSITRPLNFRFTVRDNDGTSGGTHWTDFGMQSTALAGPFKLTSLHTPDTFYRTGFSYVTWQVSNTDLSPVNCKSVNIYLSEDGGLHFPHLLVSKTPNDGGEWIQFPDKSIQKARIKIKGDQHVFFDLNDIDLFVAPALNNKIQLGIYPDQQTICTGSFSGYQLVSSTSTSLDSLKVEIVNSSSPDIKITLSKTFIKSKDSIRLQISVDPQAPSGIHTIVLQATNGKLFDTITLNFIIKIVTTNIPLLYPKNNEEQIPLLPVFKWKSSAFQDGLRIEIAQDPGFTNIFWSKLVLSDSTATPETELKGNSIYFWRLLPENGCRGTNIPFAAFHTQALECKTYKAEDIPKFISATGTPTISSAISVVDQIVLKQIRITSLSGSHDFVSDLELTLKAPSGDSVILWSRQCNNLSNFNLSIDDLAPIPISCPLTDRKAHQPLQALSRLTSSTSKGNWMLKIKDAVNGAGGSLDEWSLQLCGALEGQGPSLTINKTLELFELKSSILHSNLISFEDPDSKPEDIKILLLSSPLSGVLLKNGKDTLKQGAIFSQTELNTGLISFSAYSVTQDTLDHFDFLAYDEKNNWTGQQTFHIKIKNDVSIPNEDLSSPMAFVWYPNPAKDFIHVENKSTLPMLVNCFTIEGKLLFSKAVAGYGHEQIKIPVHGAGPFILQFISKNHTTTNKLILLN